MGDSVGVLHYTTIGDMIKRYREREQLTITQLANLSGVHKGVISKIELGDTKRPELRTIKPIANVLGILSGNSRAIHRSRAAGRCAT